MPVVFLACTHTTGLLTPFRAAPKPLPILNSSNFAANKGFPVVTALMNSFPEELQNTSVSAPSYMALVRSRRVCPPTVQASVKKNGVFYFLFFVLRAPFLANSKSYPTTPYVQGSFREKTRGQFLSSK